VKDDMSPGIVGILLAAGSASRFGGDKLQYRLPDGTPMGVAAAISLRPACAHVVAVLRPNDGDLALMLIDAGCGIIFCPEFEKGMGQSLATGIRETAEASSWVVALGDMPFIHASTHQVVADSLNAGASLVATEYQGPVGTPLGSPESGFRTCLQSMATTAAGPY
jgi:molybdenum cofactor cytidylyltransferase